MAANIASLLDKAKLINKLSSDYKLALVMGVSHSALINYRTGKTLPDARVISKICELTGDDPMPIALEIEEARASTPEAKALWHMINERLAMMTRQGVATGVFSVAALAGYFGLFPSDAQAANGCISSLTKLHIVETKRRKKVKGPALIRRCSRRAPAQNQPFFEQYREGFHHGQVQADMVSRSKAHTGNVRHVGRYWTTGPGCARRAA